MENHGILVQYEEYRQIDNTSPKEKPATQFFYKPDGKYIMCLARQFVRMRKNFVRNGAVIRREHQDWQMDYYITRAQNKDGLYICPNCGAEQTLDALLDGCDYCKSKFDISAYDDKVMSVMKNKGTYTDRSTNKETGTTTAFAVVMVLLGVPALLFGLLLAPCLKSYQNIVDCETGRISYKNFSIQGDYQYVELHREMKVVEDCGDRLRDGSGYVRMVLAKKLSHKLKNDVVLYRCNGCGASVSLLEGGKCQYCGNELDYDTYDWVIVQYQHVSEL